jgi:hypothetical protein
MDLKKEVDRLVFKYLFEENTVGGNDEAQLCLKSTIRTGWDACEDYEECVTNFADAWERKMDEGAGISKLLVKIFLPEEDLMIAEKGKFTLEIAGRRGVGRG